MWQNHPTLVPTLWPTRNGGFARQAPAALCGRRAGLRPRGRRRGRLRRGGALRVGAQGSLGENGTWVADRPAADPYTSSRTSSGSVFRPSWHPPQSHRTSGSVRKRRPNGDRITKAPSAQVGLTGRSDMGQTKHPRHDLSGIGRGLRLTAGRRAPDTGEGGRTGGE